MKKLTLNALVLSVASLCFCGCGNESRYEEQKKVLTEKARATDLDNDDFSDELPQEELIEEEIEIDEPSSKQTNL